MAEPENLSTFVKPISTLKMTEDILGCKWTLTVLHLVRQGVCRPGLMERSVDGLTTKVLNERLKKLTRYGILKRYAYPEVPPRVEYYLTPFGEKLGTILDRLIALDQELQNTLDNQKLDNPGLILQPHYYASLPKSNG